MRLPFPAIETDSWRFGLRNESARSALPLLTWIMFPKFLGDLEAQREQGATLSAKKFRPALEPPYRWRDWAANPQGITGDELLAFINQDEAVRPDGKRGAGLFAYLRRLTSANGDDRRDVIATVFRGVDNRMKSGYLPGTSSTRSPASTSPPVTSCTRWGRCTSPYCARCAIRPATPASSTRRGRSSGSWS